MAKCSMFPCTEAIRHLCLRPRRLIVLLQRGRNFSQGDVRSPPTRGWARAFCVLNCLQARVYHGTIVPKPSLFRCKQHCLLYRPLLRRIPPSAARTTLDRRSSRNNERKRSIKSRRASSTWCSSGDLCTTSLASLMEVSLVDDKCQLAQQLTQIDRKHGHEFKIPEGQHRLLS
jgi:hypothetical protein